MESSRGANTGPVGSAPLRHRGQCVTPPPFPILAGMRRLLPALLALFGLATAAAAQLLVSPPRPGEQETAQAGGGTGRFSFVGALRCAEAQAIVGVRIARGPLLNRLALGCAEVLCVAGHCRWRADELDWSAVAGQRTGEEATLLCPAAAAVAGFRAEVVPVPGGTAVRSLAIDCAPLTGREPGGAFAVASATDSRMMRRFVPPGPRPERMVAGACRDRAASAVSVAVGAYPAGFAGDGEHVRALSMFCPGPAQ